MHDPEDEGPPPLPEIIAEFDALHEQLQPLIQRTEDGEGETVRMVIDLPKEWAILAGWLELVRLGRRFKPPRPAGRPVDLNHKLSDWRRIRADVWHALHEHFHDELHSLATHSHPYLFEPSPEKQEPKTDLGLDDAIPF